MLGKPYAQSTKHNPHVAYTVTVVWQSDSIQRTSLELLKIKHTVQWLVVQERVDTTRNPTDKE
jgi:hypothetical protein